MEDDEQRVLTEALSLVPEPQDWGIVNASGSRLYDFIDFFVAHPELTRAQRFWMGELILASANEALLEGGLLDERLESFVETNREWIVVAMEYWTNLESGAEFPLSGWLRRHLFGDAGCD